MTPCFGQFGRNLAQQEQDMMLLLELGIDVMHMLNCTSVDGFLFVLFREAWGVTPEDGAVESIEL
jgi:hypothetical protein